MLFVQVTFLLSVDVCVCWGWHLVGVGLAKFLVCHVVGCLGQSFVPVCECFAMG